MALLDEMKLVLRVASEVYDPEVQMLIDAALADMERVGVDPDLLDPDDPVPLVKKAVAVYCKSHFGYDNPEAGRFDDSYYRVVCDLMNSSANIAAGD